MEAIGFIAKKLIGTFCYPFGLSLLLIVAGIAVSFFKQRKRLGLSLIVAGTAILVLFSMPITGCLLLKSLENEAPNYADPAQLKREGVRYVVVLAGDAVHPGMTPADAVGWSIFRVMEGIRLWKKLPGSKLVLSGGSYPGFSSDPEALAALPALFGIPRDAMLLETRAWDTQDEARLFAGVVGDEPFALVTTASHMWRAMKHFQSFGLRPIPCPCEFRTKRCPTTHRRFVPDVNGLGLSQSAIHEYVGTLWLVLKSSIRPPKRNPETLR